MQNYFDQENHCEFLVAVLFHFRLLFYVDFQTLICDSVPNATNIEV